VLALVPARAKAINVSIPKAEAKGKEKKAVEPEPAKPVPTEVKPTPEAEKPKETKTSEGGAAEKSGADKKINPERLPYDPSRPPVKVRILFSEEDNARQTIAVLSHLNLDPATLSEYLVIGSDYPEVEKRFPAVELASNWRIQEEVVVPFLYREDDRRFLCMVWAEKKKDSDHFYSVWGDCYRVVAVRVSSK
jgi:hypothetical protein